MVKYVPLHLHTEYSLLDGAIKIPDLYKFCAENDMPAVAITDHGVMYGCADMFIAKNEMMSHMLAEEEQELKNKIAAVKPILGCEFYVCDGPVEGEESKVQKTRYHLVLLAKNQAGYHGLCKLDSFASTDGFYFKPRINHEKLEEILEENKGNIICLSACIQGEVSRNFLDGHLEEAEERVKYYHKLFGDDYYIELQDHEIPEEKQVNPFLIEMAEKYGIKTVITNDSHFLRKEDYLWHDTLICEQTKSKKNDTNRLTFSKELYVKTVEELREAFSWMEEDYFNKCIEATVEIADKVDFEMDKLEFNKTKEYLPKYPCPDGLSEEEYFDKLCIEGLKKRYGDPIPPSHLERYEYEKSVIFKMGFPAYFLLTWDFINWAKEKNIPVGPGRGSAAGSIVAYALRITELDPIEHKLLFERFLNPERISMPDIDIDFCKRDRGKVIDYVAEKWGADHVCQIITFGTLAAKAALKAVARVYDIDFTTSNKWAGLIPSTPGTKLKDALADGTEFRKLYDENPEAKSLIEEALHLEGLKNQVGTHAAGVIIAPDAMSNIIPVAYAKEKESKDKDKAVKKSTQTQYPMAGIEKIGLLKMDFLGLETLTIMRDCLDMVKERTGEEVDINNISLKDEKTFELLKQGETDGVFQLESPGMRRVAKDLKPSVFEDLGALVAIFRPGPIEAGMVKDFVERKHGRQKIEYAHPLLEPILKETYGTILYQEQIMQIFQTLADYSLGDADMVRRMMGKKKLQQMAEQKERFVKASASKGMSAEAATKLFEQIEAFAKYCFNKAHSSAYGFIAYQTAYLKAHYPVEWMAAMLTSQADDQEKTQQYILQCNKLGIEVLPPDINKSNASFTPDGNNIRFGLASVKNVGRGVVETIMEVRKDKEFESFYDYCSRMQGKEARALNKLTLEALIKVGAFSEIEKSRKQLIENYDRVLKDVAKKKDAQDAGQVSLFAMAGENAQDLGIPTFELTGDSNDEFLDTEIQQFEHDLMGIYVSSHPLSSIKDTLKYLTTDSLTQVIQNPVNEQIVTICGLLSRVASKPTKKDPSKILKTGTIEDLSGGRMEFVVFPKTVEKYGDLIQSEEKLILTAKVQIRDEEVNLIVQEAKPIQNVNLVTLKLLEDLQFEELVYLKELLTKYSGEDPVVVDFMDEESLSEDKRVQILTNKHLWVKADETLQKGIEGYFKDKIELEIIPLGK